MFEPSPACEGAADRKDSSFADSAKRDWIDATWGTSHLRNSKDGFWRNVARSEMLCNPALRAVAWDICNSRECGAPDRRRNRGLPGCGAQA